MKKIIIILLIFFLMPFTILAQVKVKVIGVKDGDTIIVLNESNEQVVLRLAEVDCPESNQAFGKNAKQFVSNQVLKKMITFLPVTKDRYGRTIAKVYYDKGKYLSEEIIKYGYGWWYYKYSNSQKLKALEGLARKKKLGLWNDKNPIAPWTYRRMINF